jgi:hypothetical protein
VKGCGQGLLYFHVLTEKPTSSGHRRIEDPILKGGGGLTQRKRLVGGPGFQNLEVACWHIQNLPHWVPSTFG